jgi:predicted DNA-binding transcriptional regulator AlpA
MKSGDSADRLERDVEKRNTAVTAGWLKNLEEIALPDPAMVPTEHIPPILTQLAALQMALAAKLISDGGNGQAPIQTPQEQEELLTPDEAAALLSVSVDWMYRHASGLPFSKRLSRKALRFSKSGLLKWRAGRRA